MPETPKPIEFGCLARPLRKQIPKGYVDARRISVLQRRADAITTLHIGDLLTVAETNRCRIRLIRAIEAEVRGQKRA